MVTKGAVKDLFAAQGIKVMADVLPHLPDEAILSVANTLWFNNINQPEGRSAATALLLAAKRVLKDMPRESRRVAVEDLFINQMLKGQRRRVEVSEREGVNIPAFIAISPSMRCNLKCVGCYAGSYTTGDELDFETVDRIVAEAKDMGIYYINMAGGEPFLWKGTFELLQKHTDVFFQVFSNGTLLDQAACRRLAELGNAIVFVSVEGFEEETDRRRGKGVFEKIMRAMENLRECKVPFGFSATPLRETNELMVSEKFIDFWVNQQKCCGGWYFNYVPIGWKPSLDMMPTPQQRVYRWQKMQEIRQKFNVFLIDFWNDGAVGGSAWRQDTVICT